MSFVIPGVVKIPARNTFEEGAMLEPVNTVLKAVKMLQLLRGDSVLVAGQGPIGLMFTRLLKICGARVIASDLIEERLTLAHSFGASLALNAAREDFAEVILDATSRRGLDAAVIAVPSDDAARGAHDLLRGGGRLLLFAHTKRGNQTAMDLSKVCVDEKQILGSYSSDFTLQNEVADLVFGRKLDARKLITHNFPLERGAEAINLAARPNPESLKVVITPLSSQAD
jgi:L-iditol 2-dehydrogenase